MNRDRLLALFNEIVRVSGPSPFQAPPGDMVSGRIIIGRVPSTKAPFGLNLDEINEHLLITGRAGAGKTTLIYIILTQLLYYKIPFWAFDFKQDYRHLSKSGKVLVFNWATFRFNPLRPPPRVHPKVWAQAFSNVFCQNYYLLAGTKTLIFDHVDKLYTEYGSYSGSNVFPTLFDLYDSIKGEEFSGAKSRTRQYQESAENRLKQCLLSFDKTFDCDQGFLIEELLGRNVVLELDGLLIDNQSFLITLLLRHIFQYRINNSTRSGLKHILLFDEAKSVYSNSRDQNKELGTSEIAQFTSTIREFGEALVVADQMPTELSDSIKANVYTVICMSQSGGKNISEMSRTLGLSKQQEDYCRMLQADKGAHIFEAIVKLAGRWPMPFLIQVLPLQVVKAVTDADVKAYMAPHLIPLNNALIPRTEYKSLVAARKDKEEREAKAERDERRKKAEEKERADGNTLIKILTNIKDHPFISQKARVEMLDLGSSSSTTDNLFKQLWSQGLVEVHKVGLGKAGSSLTLYEITDKGAEYARMKKSTIPGKGDFKHKFWQHTIKEFYSSIGHNAEIEKRFGIKNVDVGFESSGKRTAIEVELTSDHLVENVQLDLEAGCDEIIIAVENKKHIAPYKKKLSFYNKGFLDKVEFRVLGDFRG